MNKETFAAECRKKGIVWNDMVRIGVWYHMTFFGIGCGLSIKHFEGALGYGRYKDNSDSSIGDYVQLCVMEDEHSSETEILCFEFEEIASIKLLTH